MSGMRWSSFVRSSLALLIAAGVAAAFPVEARARVWSGAARSTSFAPPSGQARGAHAAMAPIRSNTAIGPQRAGMIAPRRMVTGPMRGHVSGPGGTVRGAQRVVGRSSVAVLRAPEMPRDTSRLHFIDGRESRNVRVVRAAEMAPRLEPRAYRFARLAPRTGVLGSFRSQATVRPPGLDGARLAPLRGGRPLSAAVLPPSQRPLSPQPWIPPAMARSGSRRR